MRCVNVGATQKKEMANEKSLEAAEQRKKQKLKKKYRNKKSKSKELTRKQELYP